MGVHIGILLLISVAVIYSNTIRCKNLIQKHSFTMVFLFFIPFLSQVAVADNEVPSAPVTDQTCLENMESGFLPGDDDHLEFFRRWIEKEIPREEPLMDLTSQLTDPASDLDIAWTFLFYDDSEFIGYEPLDDFCSEAYSSENLKVFVLHDTETEPTTLWYVHEDSYPVILENWGERNMGDWETLYDFIAWGKTNYPADRYILTMYDHGGGWMGACYDITSGYDILSMDEIEDAIGGAGGVDILAFTAPCLMGALESAYELRDYVDVYIGSENISGYVFWRGIIDDICDILNNSSTLSSQEIGSLIIDLIEDNNTSPYAEWLTMSAVDQVRIQDFTEPLDELLEYMIQNMVELGPDIQTARNNAWCMTVGTTLYPEIDLYDYLLQCSEIMTNPFVLEKLLEIRQSFTPAIINECHGFQHERTHGLTIYFPSDEESYITEYGLVNLDFADYTHWNEFLEAFYDWQQSGIFHGVSDRSSWIDPSPNPFSVSTAFIYNCPPSNMVNLTIFDISGRIICTLNDEATGESGSIAWDGKDESGMFVPTGVYICILSNEYGTVAKTSVVLIR